MRTRELDHVDLPSDAEAHEALSAWLRGRVRSAELTCAVIGELVGYHRTTVSRAVAGRPASWPLILAIVRHTSPADEMRRDIETAQRLWERAHAVRSERRAREATGFPPADLDDQAALSQALRDLWGRCGASQREIVRRDKTGILRRSTVGAVLRGDRAAPTRQFVEAFVHACGGSQAVVREWAMVWDRLHEVRQHVQAARRREHYRETRRRYGLVWYQRTVWERW